MLIRPIQTEKAYTEQMKRTYMFVVPKGMSKQAIAGAVEAEYKVTVLGVRVTLRNGKPMKFSRGRRAYPGTTFRQDKKIAYVTLKDGDSIKVFETEEAAEEVKTEEKKSNVKASEEKQSEQAKKVGLFAKRRTGNRGDK